MEGKPLLSANKAQPACVKSLAQIVKKCQVAKVLFRFEYNLKLMIMLADNYRFIGAFSKQISLLC